MKKLLVLSAVAITILALSGQRASAWKQFKFGVGLNLEGSGGGNNYLWGAFKSQQPPAQGGFGGYPGAVPPGMGGYAPPFGGGFGANFGAAANPGYDIGQETGAPPMAQPTGLPANKVQPVDYQYGQYPYLPVSYQVAPYWYGR